MEWLSAWWSELNVFTQLMYCVSIPSTLILIIQTVLIIMGFGNGGPDVNFSDTSGFEIGDGGDIGDISDINDISDMHTDSVNPADAGAMHLFTFQGIITFLCVFSWMSILAYMALSNILVALLIGFVLGAAAMYGVAKLIQAMGKLAENGNIVAKNFLGESGTVYLVIPAAGKGTGKVNISVGERCAEFEAVTEDKEAIPSGAAVRVVDIRSENLLVVEKI